MRNLILIIIFILMIIYTINKPCISEGFTIKRYTRPFLRKIRRFFEKNEFELLTKGFIKFFY